jgi:hypothetical protein
MRCGERNSKGIIELYVFKFRCGLICHIYEFGSRKEQDDALHDATMLDMKRGGWSGIGEAYVIEDIHIHSAEICCLDSTYAS